MSKFKVGDKVRVIKIDDYGDRKKTVGQEFEIGKQDNLKYCNHPKLSNGFCYQDYELELINTKNMMDKIKIYFLSEPQKTYQKLGLFDNNNLPTDDGMKIYVASLMVADTAFAAKMVPVLEEEKKA